MDGRTSNNQKGDRHASSVGQAFDKFRITNFIATDLNEYIDLAKKFTGTPDYLQKLRLSLREKLKKSILCNGVTFTKNIEYAYKFIYEDYFGK